MNRRVVTPASEGPNHKVAVVVSHPIQHFCPQYASWSRIAGLSVRVFFASNHGLKAYKDKNFDRIVQWNSLSMDFPHEFLAGADGKTVNSSLDASDLGERLRAFEPDALIVYGYAQRLQRRAIRFGHCNDIPLLMIADSELRGHRTFPTRILKRIVLPMLLRPISRFLTVGDANEAYYRHYGVKDDQLIRSFFPIDVESFDKILADASSHREDVRSKHGIPPDHIVILMVGKLVTWKRQLDLVRLSNASNSGSPPMTVMLAGTGPEEEQLKKLAKRHGPGGVIFAGFVPPTALGSYYCAADVYAHCSEHEPHSLAISEAIYCGLPVVLSDRCGSYGPSDDVRVGLNGYVYGCGDIDSLRSAILRVAADDIRTAMSQESKAIARANQRLAHGQALLQALQSLA